MTLKITSNKTFHVAGRACILLAGLVLAAPAAAELTHVGAGGFTTSHSVTVPAAADAAWKAMTTRISHWWNPAHSWSGQGENLYLEDSAGGCFCERLPDGGWVEHLRIVYLAPGSKIVLRGALGPLLEMGLNGTMTWAIDTEGGSSRVTFTYIVHGHLAGGFEGIAPAVDGVIGEQLSRLEVLLTE